MPWSTLLAALVNQALLRSEQLGSKLDELRTKRFASASAPLFFADLLLSLNQELRRHLIDRANNRPNEGLNYDRYEDLASELKCYANVVAHLYMQVGYIEAARVESNPPGIVLALERIARVLVPGEVILICPSFKCVYEYHNLLSERNLRSVTYIPRVYDETVFRGRKHLAVFLYPFALRDDTLSHVLLIHELAHFVGEVKDIFETALPALPRGAPPDFTYEQVKDFFIEYVADAMSTFLVGPAFLFALIEFHTSIAGL